MAEKEEQVRQRATKRQINRSDRSSGGRLSHKSGGRYVRVHDYNDRDRRSGGSSSSNGSTLHMCFIGSSKEHMSNSYPKRGRL